MFACPTFPEMRDTKINRFLEWLQAHGPANWSQIEAAGFRSIFNGETRKRLISSGVILIDRGLNESPKSGSHRHHNIYRVGGIPYTPNKSGRRSGYRLTDDAREQMMVRSAMTILKKRGYIVFPPGSEVHG